MNAPQPRQSETLVDRLAREIDQFDPFEALRLVQSGKDADEALPVRHALTNRFVATPLQRGAGTAEIETAFVGLVGLIGPLPPFYTETALREKKRRSHALRGFLDIFLKRIVALFVGAHEKYRLPSLIARQGAEGQHAVTDAIYALMGLGLPALRNRLLTDDWCLLPYAGILAREVRSAAGLEVILADQFGLKVKVEPMRRRWLPIEAHEQTRLGGGFSRLGTDAVAGARTLDVSSTFRVVLGPVDYGTFQWLSPGSPAMTRIAELVRFYMEPGLDFDVQVILVKEDVPESRLGATAPRLGWNGWLRKLPALRDADQAIFDPGLG